MKSKTRKIRRIVALLLLLSLTVWVATRWHVWFGNPEELAVEPLHTPGHVLLTFGDDNESSRNVSWQCDTVLRPSFLELVCDGDTTRIESQGEVFESRKGRAAYYVARLRGLKPEMHYRYRAVSGNDCSPWYSFQTYTPNRDHFSFLFVGDVQDTIGGVANKWLMEAWAHHPEVEFLVCGGDLTERPTNQDWAETFLTIDSIGQSMPMLNVTGNHDYFKGVIQRLERRFPLVFSYFLDSKVGDNMVYTLNYGEAQLFVLDSNREFFYLWSQRQWLEEQLVKSTAKWKILVLHHPLYSIKGKNNAIQQWMFDDLVHQYGVDLVLQGHEHAYARMTAHENGSPAAPVYTVSHCSPKNYRIQFDERFDKFGISSRYYQTVNVHGDTLAMATYDANTHALYDSLMIIINPEKEFQWRPVRDLGKDIPENLDFTLDPNNKKDRKFAERVVEYKKSHPERF
jgi:predicted phosphodiesterase